MGQLRFIRTLRGLTPSFPSFNDAEFDEAKFEQHLEADPHPVFATCWYWIRKLQARFYGGDYGSALAAASKAERLLQQGPIHFESVEYRFYDALARAAQYDFASSEERPQYLEALAAQHRQINLWAENCPENFRNRAALVGAEIARIEARELDAERLYEQAIRSARENGFPQNEAMANELAAKFYLARGYETSGYAYLRNARYCYLRWGALGKVRQLDQRYPHLHEERVPASSTVTIGTPLEQLDLGTMIKASQAVSSEIVLGKLMETLMVIAIEHAGADRGLLILLHGQEPQIEAEATTGSDRVEVTLREAAVTPSELPESVLHYVIRTRESVILDDAASPTLFSTDPYVHRRRPRSVLCLPLLKQAKLMGVIYLENSLTPRVFAPDRLAVLELLTSQAAISLDNARVCTELARLNTTELARSEEKFRALFEGTSLAVVLLDENGILEANPSWLRLLGYTSLAEVVGKTPTELSAPIQPGGQRAEVLARMLVDHALANGSERFEWVMLRCDGTELPVEIFLTRLQLGGRQLIQAVCNDITQRKQAETELVRTLAREKELGQLRSKFVSMVSHEFRTPLGIIQSSAEILEDYLDRLEPAERQGHLQSIRKNTCRMARTMEEVLLIGSFDAGKMEFKPAALDLRTFVRGLVDEVLAATSRHCPIELSVSELPAKIQADERLLRHIFTNLLTNAVKYSDAGRAVRFEIGRVGAEVVCAIRDRGIGIPEADREWLFSAFHRGHNVDDRPGTGLGLVIVKRCVDLQGGKINVESKLGEGTTVTISLPIVCPCPAAAIARTST